MVVHSYSLGDVLCVLQVEAEFHASVVAVVALRKGPNWMNWTNWMNWMNWMNWLSS